jgi:SAM-dependent methyltransferase
MVLVAYSADPMKTRKRKKEWFDDDSFWRELYAFMFPEKRIAEAQEQIAKVLALTKPKGKSVLDLCCGPGRCSIALANKGFAVTGVDRTKYLLDRARAKASAARVKIEWVQLDMRDFVRPDSFALVLSMFTSFGYFDDKREDMMVLENMFTSLQPGGACLIEVLGKERLAKILQPTSSTVLPDGTLLVERHEIFDDWTRVRMDHDSERPGEEFQISSHDLFRARAAGPAATRGIRFRDPPREPGRRRVWSVCRAAHCDRAQTDFKASVKAPCRCVGQSP